jgi:uncharacterized protein (DUF1330 family)
MAPGYLLVTMNISDPERYKQYMAEAPKAVKAFGGEYLVRGGKHETLEGEWNPHRIAVLRFPSYERAKAFYDDAQYTQIRQLRQGATEYFNMVLVEGFLPPET